MIMESEESHNLLSAIWRPRKAYSVIQFESRGLRLRRVSGINPSPKAEDRCSSPFSQIKASSPFLHLFVPFRLSTNWMRRTTLGRLTCFTQSVIQMLIRKHLHR